MCDVYCMYVCIIIVVCIALVITYCRVVPVPDMDQPGKVANSARGQLKRNIFFRFPRSRLRIWSRETSFAVPSHVSLLTLHTLLLNLVRTHGILPAFHNGIHFSFEPSAIIVLVPSLLGCVIADRRPSLLGVHQHRANGPQLS